MLEVRGALVCLGGLQVSLRCQLGLNLRRKLLDLEDALLVLLVEVIEVCDVAVLGLEVEDVHGVAWLDAEIG